MTAQNRKKDIPVGERRYRVTTDRKDAEHPVRGEVSRSRNLGYGEAVRKAGLGEHDADRVAGMGRYSRVRVRERTEDGTDRAVVIRTRNKKPDKPLQDRRYKAKVYAVSQVSSGDYLAVKQSMYTTKEHDYDYMKKYLGGDEAKLKKMETMKKGSSVRKKTTVKKGSQKTTTRAKVIRTANTKCKGKCGSCTSCRNLKSPEYTWKRV